MDWNTLRDLIEEAELDELADAMRGLDQEQRRALAEPLVEYERRARLPENTADLFRRSAALAVAGAGVLRVSELAPWLVRNELGQLLDWAAPFPEPRGSRAADCVREILIAREAPLPALAEKLAQRLRPRGATDLDPWSLITALAGYALPTGDGFVFHWPAAVDSEKSGILRHFRRDPRFLELVPRLFEVDGVARKLARHEDVPGWPDALAALAADGEVDRLVLLDGLLGSLQRSGTRAEGAPLIDLHDLLAPSLDEATERVGDYAALVPDGHSTVAGFAQRELLRLDEAGRLPLDVLLDVSRAMFLRAEKKLVRVQLSLLDKAIRRGNGEALQPLAVLFSYGSVDLQERALKLALEHAERIGPELRGELAAAATALAPDLRPCAAEVLGAVGPRTAAVPAMSPVPRSEMPPPIASVDELAAEVSAHCASLHREWLIDPVRVERIIAGLVAFAHTDRAALRSAFEPVLAACPWLSPGSQEHNEYLMFQLDTTLSEVFDEVIKAALGECHGTVGAPVPASIPGEAEWLEWLSRDVDRRSLWLYRLYELRVGLAVAPRPFLMSTPTEASGLIAPEALAERLERAAELGFEPWEHDLVVALLRLPRDAAIADRVRGLGAAGASVARWIESGGLGNPEIRRAVRPVEVDPWGDPHFEERTRVTVRFPDSADPVRKSFDDAAAGRYSMYHEFRWQRAVPSLLPAHRDVSAAHLVAAFEGGARRAGPVLDALVGCHGPVGDGMNTVLAFALGAGEAEDRACAADALIALESRDGLRGADLGDAIADLVIRDEVVLGRVVRAVRDAASGVPRAAWEMVAVLVERLLPAEGERPGTALADLLALGVELAAAAAARGGSSRFVKEARRLHQVLSAT
ncbi:DUF6493 family protein [Saccharopolyspora sp. NPDC050642]|uniref:DUF6493 family protein n=1 Tax=Saccharopolyspora sp. NPDC050642 TaxID=3157099 RepID=UPI0033FEAB05